VYLCTVKFKLLVFSIINNCEVILSLVKIRPMHPEERSLLYKCPCGIKLVEAKKSVACHLI
jgi:hypothetical protein